MIENLPLYISLVFGLTVISTLMLFVWVLRYSKLVAVKKSSGKIVFGLSSWLAIQALLTLKHVYNTDTNSIPPKIIVLGIMPAILIIFSLFVTKKGRQFIDSLSLEKITWLNTVRIPVEIVLYWLFLSNAIPKLMTFDGRNYDIVAGLTAPIIAYYGIAKGKMNKKAILVWNLVCLGLLINIVVNAFLSSPSPLQRFAFDQPNIAILSFPFSWLPTFIVPIILFGHLVSIRQILKKSR